MFTLTIEEKREPDFQDVFIITGHVMVHAGAKSVPFKIGPFPQSEEGMHYLQEAIAVIESMGETTASEFAKHGYNNVEGFANWFESCDNRTQAGIDQKYIEFTTADREHRSWPWDAVYRMHGKFERYVVGYYDHQGMHHNVKISHSK